MYDYSQIMSLLQHALLHPEEGLPAGLDDQALKNMETRVGMKLPDSYKDWLKVTNAPCVGSGGFVGFSSHRRILDIGTIYQCYPVWKDLGWIPVANDGSGNFYILIDRGDAESSVAFVDTHDDPARLTFVVASNLRTFVDMFIRRESGDRRWPFDREYVQQIDPQIEDLRHVAPMPWD